MTFDYSILTISKCRNLLMGYAILGVLIGHIISFGGIEGNGAINVLSWFCGLVHTAGFLFLSGFGVYYSLHKNGSITAFYQRRLYRFLLPFFMMAIPFFLLVCYVNGYGVLKYLSYISTVEFWVNGNYHGMWYIAVSLLLYVITPPICKISAKLNVSELVRDVSLVCLSILVCYGIKTASADYYELVSIGLTPLPMFYVGFLLGDLSQRQVGHQTKAMLLLCGVTALFHFLDVQVYGIGYIAHRLFGILLACFMFRVIIDSKGNPVLVIFNWLGKYTFELYILHIYYWFIIKGIHPEGAVFNIVAAVALSLLTCAPVHWMIGKVENKIKSLI